MMMESDERPKKVDGSDDIFMVGRGKFGLNPGTSYLMNFEKKVLIETGTSLNVPDILSDLSEAGVKKLDYVAVTHIHLDHAGGASFLVERFPKLKF